MAGAEGERPASPAPEAAASPEQAKPAAQEPKTATIARVPSIPVATRPNDGVGERPPPLPPPLPAARFVPAASPSAPHASL